MKQRCPEWAVTPHRVKKALAALKKKRAGKKGSGALGSKDAALRPYPHDVVELRQATRARHAQWQWRGQVLRVAGYDDGETSDDEGQDLPPGHCSVFWLGVGLEQWANALTKESALRVLDRPWVLGDRVARVEDPKSLGTIVGVDCGLRFSAVPGPTEISPEVPVQNVRAVGGFRAEDWVAHLDSRWVGKVEEAVYRVEVELCSKSQSRPCLQRMANARRKGSSTNSPLCAFQVSSEGLPGLLPADGEDVTPQELSPHFPGQRVKAPARLWRQAEWIRGGLGQRSPRRGTSVCGVVSTVECCLLAVRWLAGVSKEAQPPDEWVAPSVLRTLTMPNSSEGWAIGEHVQAPSSWNCLSAAIAESRTSVDVRWADGSVEEGVSSQRLCPRPHISARDFLPHDFVARSDGSEGFSSAPPVSTAPVSGGAFRGHGIEENLNQESTYGEANLDEPLYGISSEEARANEAAAVAGEILPAEGHWELPEAHLPLGVVTGVNLQARTAIVQWTLPPAGSAGSPAPGGSQATVTTEEVSVFELADHPDIDVRLGDAVLVPTLSVTMSSGMVHPAFPWTAEGYSAHDRLRWAGRVSAFRTDGSACVELLDGTSQWYDVRLLIVVDDGEGSQGPEDEGSQLGSAQHGSDDARSEGALSEISDEARDNVSEVEESAAAHEHGDQERGSVWSAISGFFWGSKPDEKQPEAKEEKTASPGRGEMASSTAASASSSAVVESALESLALGSCEGGGSSSSRASPFSGSGPAAFDAFDEDVEPLDHAFLTGAPLPTRQLMAAVRREMVVLRKGLLDGCETGSTAPIIVRAYSSRSDLFRCMVVGPPGTPYALVPFFFDLALPAEYPREPPLAHFHAHYVGNERLNPNLYVDGKVCLSLLGTWHGPAWEPQRSTLLQVLVSLQGLVLVEEPYFNEPGHECDVGTEQGRQSSGLYNEHARLLAIRAALNSSQNPPRGFEEIVAGYFAHAGPQLLKECEEALIEPSASKSSEGFRKVLAKSLLPRLHERWGIASVVAAETPLPRLRESTAGVGETSSACPSSEVNNSSCTASSL